MNDDFETRLLAIELRQEGKDVTSICESLNRSRPWFYKWYNRYQEQGEGGLKDLSKAPHTVANKTNTKIEDEVIKVRKFLQNGNSAETKYAHIGADSIQWELERSGTLSPNQIPSLPTLNRIIKRNNLIKKQTISKRQPLPYPGPVIDSPNSVHQLDNIGPRYIQAKNGTERFYCINLIDCYSKSTCNVISENTQGKTILKFLIYEVWSVIGIPKVLQVDNMLAIKGSNRYPRSISTIIKWCLYLGIEVLFIPINEPQRNGFVEKSNGKFDLKFFRIQTFESLSHLRKELQSYNYATNVRFANPTLKKNIHGARTPHAVHFNNDVTLLKDVDKIEKRLNKISIPDGKISFVRFIKKDCQLNIFTEIFDLPTKYRYSYVKATIDTKSQILTVSNEEHVHTIKYLLNNKV